MTKKGYNYVRKAFRFDGVHYVVTGKTEEEAIAKKLAKLRELEAGRIDSNVTVKVWAASWYETYVSHRKITAKTKATYKRYLDIICAEIGAQKLKKITPLRLQQLLNEREGISRSCVRVTLPAPRKAPETLEKSRFSGLFAVRFWIAVNRQSGI